jgi:hypothetical protein
MAVAIREMPMKEFKVALPRRDILKTAGLGVGAGLLSGMTTPAQAATDGEIWTSEYALHFPQAPWRAKGR